MTAHNNIQDRRMNVKTGTIYDHVPVPVHTGYYGNTQGVSANRMYKRYMNWFTAKYPEKHPMAFVEWIKWAKSKKLIVNADGDDTPEEVKEAAKVAMGTGKKVAIAVLVVAGIMLVINAVRPFTNQSAGAPAAAPPAV